MHDELIVREQDRVVWLTLNRPARRNALTPELIERILAELDRIEAAGEARVVVVTGAPPAFCAGFDIERIDSPAGQSAGAEKDLVETLCARVRRIRVPVIAQVNGAASGTGCDLAVSCDLRIASSEARLAMPPARLGLLYSWEGTARLVAAVGPAAAKELLLTGELVDAARALQLGLVQRVVPPDELEGETRRLAETIAANAPLSVAASKLMVNRLSDALLDADALAEIQEASRAVWASEDSQEGPRAFRERRPPRFVGH